MFNAEKHGKNFMVSVAMKGNYSVINGPCFLDEAILQAEGYDGRDEKATVYDRRTGEEVFTSSPKRGWFNRVCASGHDVEGARDFMNAFF